MTYNGSSRMNEIATVKNQNNTIIQYHHKQQGCPFNRLTEKLIGCRQYS